MRIFGRGRRDQDETPDEVSDLESGSGLDGADEPLDDIEVDAGKVDDADERDDADDATTRADSDRPVADIVPDEPVDRSDGPFDLAELDDELDRLDLGSLRIAPEPGTELRLEVEQESQQLVSVMAVVGASQVQLSVFAAPRTAGIWAEIRSEITRSVLDGGGTAEEGIGPLGVELQARIPSQGPDGRTVFAPARFIGVDGPRWFLRAVLYGPAALEEKAAEPLVALVRGVVVVRGDQAMAPRELLPLRLPEDPNASPPEAEAPEEDGRSADDLFPFERGPEITEVH